MSLLQRLLNLIPHVTITVGGKPYLTRYYLFGADRERGNLFLHHFHSSDQGEEFHNHPWRWGASLILAGGYVEERTRSSFFLGSAKVEVLERRSGSFSYFTDEDFHRVDLLDPARGCWTLFACGARYKSWGFLDRRGVYRDWTTNPEAIP